MDDRMISAVEKIAEELRQIRINSSIIAHALGGQVSEGNETAAESLTKIAKSLQGVAEFTETSSYSLADVAAQVKSIADGIGEPDEDKNYHLCESLTDIAFYLGRDDESPAARIAASLEKLATKA